VLKIGTRSPLVTKLRSRLHSIGVQIPQSEQPDIFDKQLAASIKRCQLMFNLEDDGVVGAATLSEINRSNEHRMLQIRANLERWRWLDRDLGKRHIRVNIANFQMQYVNGDEVIRKNVIVGKQFRQTPVFSGVMTYLVFNPTWNVPHSIAVKDKLPRIHQDPGYLERGGYTLLRGWGVQERPVDPYSIDWSTVNKHNFRWHIRQNPGEFNALGRVKFMFPNSYAVYLHDTPGKNLFEHTMRNFSSGCIRVDNPLALADVLLKDNGGWDRERIDEIIESEKETTIKLKKPLPVHVLYFTTIIDSETKEIRYLNDIYNRDEPIIAELNAFSEPVAQN
ncbi:MAG: L,D-transpeptidase family protein, partial [Gammaproteobacteria bacterium]|nr:L,D-transpeptidase family protein [Gammaproteobacteria bacterium]